MYECPNCAANLRFSIPNQGLYCEACGSLFNPYDIVKDKDAEENQFFEVNVFTCPQCGGEIITEDNEATAFCSYCGGSTILDSRISSVRRPQFIIPFQVSKQDCVESYRKMTKGAIFASKEVKNSQNIESFRGIYMPYWSYHLEKKGDVTISGTKTYTRGDYKYTENHMLSTNIDSTFDNVSFDASSSFSDSLSQGIAPFDQTKQVPFTPSFLSGFYADTNDINAVIYSEDAEKLTGEFIYNNLVKEPPVSHYSVKEASTKPKLNATCMGGNLVMLPVWFMSLRTREKGVERVSYSVVNGQTGKVAADIPISMTKYLGISAIVGLIIFALLNFVFDLTVNARWVYIIPTIFCVIMHFVYRSREKEINSRIEGTDDKGIQAAADNKKSFSNGTSFADASINAQDAALNNSFDGSSAEASSSNGEQATKKKEKGKKKPTFFWIPLVLAIVLFFAQPVSDMPYYAVTILSMVFMIAMIIRTVGRFNELTTRQLPQFNRTGGDDDVQR